MGELRKEERLFLELGKRRRAISADAIAKAEARAAAEDLSVIEALVASNALSSADADAIREELVALSFTCPVCESTDFLEIGEPRDEARRCDECIRKSSKGTARAARSVSLPEANPTHAHRTSGERKAVIPEGGDDPAQKTVDASAAPGRPGADVGVGVGTLLGGHRIEEKLGEGGMGRVYRARHLRLDVARAIKVIDEHLVAQPNFVEQFEAEAKTLAKVPHPHIVQVHDVGTDANGVHFIVMELLEGGSVEGLWKARGKKLPLDEATRIVREAALGLHHAHQAGLIHRDVKPGNLMLAKDGAVKVVDFGLAVRTENEVFIAEGIAGTPHYMAPEQVDSRRLDARCDQYALGATFFQLLCGRPVFDGKKKSYDIFLAHVNEPPPRPSELVPELPSWVDVVIGRMLAKKPEERFPSLASVVDALERKGEATRAAPVAAPAPPPRIDFSEVAKAEKGLKPVPVPPPTWRPALATMAACAAAATLFLLVPARAAFGGADLSLGSVPGFVLKLDKKARSLAATDRPEDLASALSLLDEAIARLEKRAGAATLAQLRDELLARRQNLAASTEGALAKRVDELLGQKHFGAVIELASPSSKSLVALGLGPKAILWRDSALKALLARNEVYVPAGPYRSGPAAEPATLPGFYIDRTEVTNETWAEALEKASLERPSSWPAGPLPRELAKRPVTDVTFEQAQRYARWAGRRLPTSAEWEKAARGEDARAWPWGETFVPGRANLLEGGSGALEDVTAREGDASPWGVLGMGGNALEWVQGPEGALVAGGGFRSSALSARVFARATLVELRHPAVGFRCARDAD
ncbi:MAG TPA: bifunctional serine/threonine-protein kinase/formylglycine-generating enzyme family protein [Planctomycetota bacterium]|nr:bifunctional serine/threonine-protein kinase/formylglycine-generating enzyme family protein [Planctomycetota bacterium]